MEIVSKRKEVLVKSIALLVSIFGLTLFGLGYLLIAPLYGVESNVDLWSPLAKVIETDYNGNGTINEIAKDYYHFSLGSRPISEIKSEISTPEEAILFRDFNFIYVQDKDQYGQMEYVSSLEEFYLNGFKGDCEDFAIAIAGLLEDDGYAPITLSLQKEASKEEIVKYGLIENSDSLIIGHRIYIYEENSKFGSIGTSSQDDRKAVFDSINDLVDSFNINSEEFDYKLASNNPIKNLNNEFPNQAWLYNTGNLKK